MSTCPTALCHATMTATEAKLPTTTTSEMNGSSSQSASSRRSSTPDRNPTFRPVPLPSSSHEKVHAIDYFTGPLDVRHHSKYPLFLRLHGSVLPKMIVPLCFVAVWATAVSCISKFVYKLEVNSLLLTVLGFVVSLGLNFRSNTGYERYSEGARYWAQRMFSPFFLTHAGIIQGCPVSSLDADVLWNCF